MTSNRKFQCGLRGMARFCAVQLVYRAEIMNCSPGKIAKEGINEAFITEDVAVSEMDRDFFEQLLKVMEDNLPHIDEVISQNLSDNWKFDRLDNVMKAILRLGTAELLYLKDIHCNVIFNEYIEISKSFFQKNEVAFINGLLNSVSKL